MKEPCFDSARQIARAIPLPPARGEAQTQRLNQAVEGRRPVHFYGRCGGMVPGGDELLAEFRRVMSGGAR